MTLEEPLGLLLLAFPLLILLVLDRLLRRRIIQPNAYHLLTGILDSLPRLPASFLARVKIQRILLVAAGILMALSAAQPIFGDDPSGPVKVIIYLDGNSNWNDPEGRPAGWKGVIRTAQEIFSSLRKDDLVMMSGYSGGTLAARFVSPGHASSIVEDLPPSDLTRAPKKVLGELSLLRQFHRAEHVYIVTPFPSRWRVDDKDKDALFRVVASPPPPPAVNFAIVDVDLRAELLEPLRVSIFCRIAAFGSRENFTEPREATLQLLTNSRLVKEKKVVITPGSSRGLTFTDLTLDPGVLVLRLAPADYYLADNYYRSVIRAEPFLTAGLIAPGNEHLRAALESLPGLIIHEINGSGRGEAGVPDADVVVVDNSSPPAGIGNQLVLRPPRDLPGLPQRGVVSEPTVIEADYTHPALEGVSFSSLRIDRLPVYLPAGSMEVLAKADGYPIIMIGENFPRGRIAVIGFDPFSTGWSQEPSFPVLIANLTSWVGAESASAAKALPVGFPLDKSLETSSVWQLRPGGGEIRVADTFQSDARIALAGRHRIRGRGDLYVNLLDERLSGGIVAEEHSRVGHHMPDALPFRWEMRNPFLLMAIFLLVLERIVTPRIRAGRIA